MNVRRWLHEHSLKLLAIRDTPEAIAGGVAIGIFFGFSPLFGLKTLSAILLAWLTRSNILAAVFAVSAHDVFLVVMPAVYLYEYDVGHWLLTGDWPQGAVRHLLSLSNFRTWTRFVTVGKPMLIGATVFGAPVAGVAFVVTRRIVERHQKKKRLQEAAALPG